MCFESFGVQSALKQESIFGQELVFTQESITRQESVFTQEYFSDKNSGLDCFKTCERSEQRRASEARSVVNSADAFRDTHM